MTKIIQFIAVLAVLVFFSGQARAQLYGLANEEIKTMSETNTPRINGFGESSLYRIDPDTGNAALIGPTGFFFCRGLDFHPVTNVLYAGCIIEPVGDALITIDINTGQGTEIGLMNAEGLLQDLSFRSDGTLFGYFRAKGSNFLATIDLQTGQADFVGNSGLSGEGNGIGFDGVNDLFLTDTNTLPALYLLNQSNGLGTLVADLTLPPLDEGFIVINSLDLNPGTNVMFGSLDVQAFSYDNYLVTVDTETGVVTNIGETVEGLEAIAFLNPRVSNIPTMSEYGMAAIGLALFSISIFVLYRRKRAAVA